MPIVVIVDDEPMVCRALARELETFEQAICATAAEAYAALARGSILAVVSDYSLGPGDDGLAILAAARRLEPRPLLLLVSGAPNERCYAALAAQEIDALVWKPWTPGELAAMVSAWDRRGSAPPAPTSAKR